MSANSVISPDGVILPIWLLLYSLNQRFPSGPTRMPPSPLPGLGSSNSVMLAQACEPNRLSATTTVEMKLRCFNMRVSFQERDPSVTDRSPRGHPHDSQ